MILNSLSPHLNIFERFQPLPTATNCSRILSPHYSKLTAIIDLTLEVEEAASSFLLLLLLLNPIPLSLYQFSLHHFAILLALLHFTSVPFLYILLLFLNSLHSQTTQSGFARDKLCAGVYTCSLDIIRYMKIH